MTRVPYWHNSANALYVVLDPFSGTTGLTAVQLDRKFTGIELSPDFARLAAERLSGAARSERGPA
jgi:DNA modification methylase